MRICSIVVAPLIQLVYSCAPQYTQCSPSGAQSSPEPSLGPDMADLYVDLVHSVQPRSAKKRSLAFDLRLRATSSAGLCCAEGTQCLLLQDRHLPFCYDNYTTNYFLPSGSTGQIVSGQYAAADGSSANLLNGSFSSIDGSRGNIYTQGPPNTATLAIPMQYTAAGAGSAIPASALGQEVTVTTTIPGTTLEPSVIPRTTVDISSAGQSASPLVEAETTIPGTTIAATIRTFVTHLPASTQTRQGSGAERLLCVSAWHWYLVILACLT